MGFFRPTPKFLFLSFLILSTGAAYMYMYVSNNGVELSPKVSEEIVIGALAGEKENWDSLAEAEKEQSRRLATLKAYCEKNSVDPSQTQVKSHLVFLENIQTAYCYVPKAGCTTMKTLFYNLEHNKTERSISISHAEFFKNKDSYTARHEHTRRWIHLQRFKTLGSYSKEEASLRLATYRKIIVVRDPLERLASAWINKFVEMPKIGRDFWWTMELNHGLRTYRERNRPDKINYDFIAHTDTVASDVRLFLKKNNITANEDILPEQRPRQANDDNVFGGIYGQVPIQDILPLRDIFQEDFDMFGYSFEQDLAKIREGKAKAKG
ncbi:PREDICTED: carbohydrate sulfotransferase 12-like isoform X2 [Branchiostoma belcheri]|uniref:Carbohydrate sulfotransferase n=1 Tax=Branchiostoma belcheri TaxID=7741 RepID=A0A6P4YAI5_BRABE|nr:PREDICTED: carbohydrate sulfotransferase 12-like isoform X2 [Branchiostoma belcheri]